MPVYTYRCAQGHSWDEVRSFEGSETSEELCTTCLENADRHGVEIYDAELPDFLGKKVPATHSPKVVRGTPKFYPNRK